MNVENGLGEYLHWNAHGQTRSLAHGVYVAASRLLVDWDSSLGIGSLAAVSGDRLRVLAERLEHGESLPDVESVFSIVA